MSTDDLLRNLSIARSQLNALRLDPSGEDAPKHIDAALHVISIVRDEIEQQREREKLPTRAVGVA